LTRLKVKNGSDFPKKSFLSNFVALNCKDISSWNRNERHYPLQCKRKTIYWQNLCTSTMRKYFRKTVSTNCHWFPTLLFYGGMHISFWCYCLQRVL